MTKGDLCVSCKKNKHCKNIKDVYIIEINHSDNKGIEYHQKITDVSNVADILNMPVKTLQKSINNHSNVFIKMEANND